MGTPDMNSAARWRAPEQLLAALLGCCMVVLCLAAMARSAEAQRPDAAKSASNAKKLGAVEAQRAVEAGISALNAGRASRAVKTLSAALEAGSLPPSQSARALYYRGLAYRKANKPARAISDLTAALWLKGGLDGQMRARAQQARAAAYAKVGLNAAPIAANPRPRTDEPSATAASEGPDAAARPGAKISVAKVPAQPSGPLGGLFGGLFGGGSAPTVTSTTPKPAEQKPKPAVIASGFQTTIRRAPHARPKAAPLASISRAGDRPRPPTLQQRPRPAKPQATSWSRTAKPTKPRPRPRPASSWSSAKVKVVRRSRRVPAARPPVAPTRQPSRTRSSQTRQVKPTARAAAVERSRQRKAKAPARVASAAMPDGRSYQVQVAAVRSAQAAAGVAAQLRQQFGRELGGRAPVVDQRVVGNLGTIYRVHVGPFRSAAESQRLCRKLKAAGMACRVTTRAQ